MLKTQIGANLPRLRTTIQVVIGYFDCDNSKEGKLPKFMVNMALVINFKFGKRLKKYLEKKFPEGEPREPLEPTRTRFESNA
jgi:hypothetical protein